MKAYEKLFSEAYDMHTYPDAEPVIDVGGSVGQVSSQPMEIGSAYAVTRGLAEAEIALPGELEGWINGLVNAYNNPQNKSRIDAFLDGLAKDTKLPRLEKVQQLLDKYLPEVSAEFDISRDIGTIVAPGAAVGAAVKAGKAVKKMSPAVVPATQMPKSDKKPKASK